MSPYHAERVRPGYQPEIDAVRARLADDVIVDTLERWLAGGLDRDEAMEILDIDYIGTLYELRFAYDVTEPEPDPVEDARQAEMMRLLLDGQEVPQNLMIPASWVVRKH